MVVFSLTKDQSIVLQGGIVVRVIEIVGDEVHLAIERLAENDKESLQEESLQAEHETKHDVAPRREKYPRLRMPKECGR
jgi:preprotein translocase subunit YajC